MPTTILNRTERIISVKCRRSGAPTDDVKEIGSRVIKLYFNPGLNSVNDELWGHAKELDYIDDLIANGDIEVTGRTPPKNMVDELKAKLMEKEAEAKKYKQELEESKSKKSKKGASTNKKSEPEVAIQVPGE